MNIPPVSKSPWLRLVLAACAVISLTSCAHHTRLSAPAELAALPASVGPNYGSIVAWTPWFYLGSRTNTHEFIYYFNRDSMLRHRRVTLPRSATRLDFPEVAYRPKVGQWATLTSDSSSFRFRPHHLRQREIR
jgi:hypothetical protein